MLTSVKYWLWLTSRLDPIHAWKVYSHFGAPEKAYFSDPEEYAAIDGLTAGHRKLLEDKSVSVAEEILARCDRENIRVLTYADTDFPERLRTMAVPPLVLYLRGRLIRFDERAVIAFAGTRKATPYGIRIARDFAFDVTKGGGIVATGVVSGCDEAAARGALRAGGPLAAVVAGGVDVAYYDSDASRALMADIAARGAVISELPPGTPHKGGYFKRRNSILCALSSGLLCVEAGERSGTLGVAALAAEQGKDVFAVPANLGAKQSAGTNDLLRQGLAIAALSAKDILGRYPFLLPQAGAKPDMTRWRTLSIHPSEDPDASLSQLIERAKARQTADEQPEMPQKEAETPLSAPAPAEKKVDTAPNSRYIELLNTSSRFTDEERTLLKALLDGPATMEGLIAATGLTTSAAAASLTMLVIGGQAEELSGGRYRILTEGLE